jgi:hypothetical protein
MFMKEKANDLYFSSEGDLVFSEDTYDLLDTKQSPYRAFIQKIITRIESQKFEWKHDPQLGLGLSDFLGKANTEALAEQIKLRISSELTKGGLLRDSDFETLIFPTSQTSIMIMLYIYIESKQKKLQLGFSYSTSENRISSKFN